MLFNSGTFVAFLAVVLPLYHLLGLRSQNRLLLLGSYVFYGWWDWRFLLLLAASTAVDYWCAKRIDQSADTRARRRLLLLSIVFNLGVLAFFKYCGFFVASFMTLLQAFGMHASAPVLGIVLPVGISFYTFQTMGYTIDVYRGTTRPAADLLSFALYVAYFPQLVAGPIERSAALLPRLQAPRRVDAAMLASACQLVLLGYFKKVCIADGVAPWVDRAFVAPEMCSATTLWLATYLFAVQIYGDFSGYSDIARGVSRLFGIELCVNFRQPYLSASVTEFWRRWHISLSTWLRDYLYIPLGGSRRGAARTSINLMLTMCLGGLWHGAAWTFVVWGALHGLYLVVHKRWQGAREARSAASAAQRGTRRHALRHALAILATFHLVCLAWIFFRAASLADACACIATMCTGPWRAAPMLEVVALCYVLLMLLADVPCWWHEREVPFASSWPAWRRGLAYAAMLLLLSFVGPADARPFIYFQF